MVKNEIKRNQRKNWLLIEEKVTAAYIKLYSVSTFKNWLSCGTRYTLHNFIIGVDNYKNKFSTTTW